MQWFNYLYENIAEQLDIAIRNNEFSICFIPNITFKDNVSIILSVGLLFFYHQISSGQ